MNPIHSNSNATIIPTLRYRDGQAAIDWLCKAFGYKKQLGVPDKSGAQVRLLSRHRRNSFVSFAAQSVVSANFGP
jgi:uncharacterized glyoxalase superfamily protein PhnB